MQDKKFLKQEGIRFARSLQTLVKMVNMFSADHKSAAGLLQRTYELLNPLVKSSRTLTLGFVDQRILLNNILTVEESLKPLENEFLKRGIGAVTFEAGITLAGFREAMGAIAASPKTIAESGGLMPFLEQKHLEFVRVFPASKSERRNEDGDTELEMSSEEFLISKALNRMDQGFSQSVDVMLSQMEGGSGGMNGREAAFRSANAPFGSGHAGSSVRGASARTTEQGPQVATPSAAAVQRDGARPLNDLQSVAEQKFEASLRNPDQDPQTAFLELAKALQTARPDVVLSNLVADQRGGAASTAQDLTTEVFEESALKWAVKRLAVVPAGDDAVIIEEQVFRVLMRSLQATHAASRLARKLAEYAREYALPPETLKRIQAEVRWLTLTPRQKLLELLAVTHFSDGEFGRCLELIREFVRQGDHEHATALAVQYLSVFDDHLSLQSHEITRIPELLRAMAGVQGDFWEACMDRLTKAAQCHLEPSIHPQIVNALVALSCVAATYENFALVEQVGSCLEATAAQNQSEHAACCSAALASLLPPSAVDRLSELFLQKKQDSAWVKSAAGILRWMGDDAIERIFNALDNETTAANRLAIMRLLSRMGMAACAAAHRRLTRPEWYVVRNACKLLGELKDPELLEHIGAAFLNSDERVQKAAMQAVAETRLPGRSAVLAAALPKLSPALIEEACYELAYLGEPEALPALEHCLGEALPSTLLTRVVQAMAAVQGAAAGAALLRATRNEKLPPNVRAAAERALKDRALRRLAKDQEQPQASDTAVSLGYAGA